ncbi:LysM peptidoglycan-binding domain-containing protein [Polymorphospora rubra]|uniref:LysM peptidoglycan-binding domain-containing protein n=1 Tax=Polymorphospora rubra TaxID=338584 RepID=UPI0033C55E79
MTGTRVSVPRRIGRVLTGLGALVVLIALLFGAPAALIAVAGNPLPDHLPTFAEVTDALTSRDDGQLFLRALAVVGWLGWATFALSVLVELPARALRRPAPRLPGMRRQQRIAAALVGTVAMVVVAAPAATAATAGPTVTHATVTTAAPQWLVPPVTTPGPVVVETTGDSRSAVVYRVERGDFLGHIADRYLGDFDGYQEIAALNEVRDPDRIRPGQTLRLPDHAVDRGARTHATGTVSVPAKPAPAAPTPAAPQQPTPEQPAPDQPPAAETPSQRPTTSFAGGAAGRPGGPDTANRPLAVTAVIAAASIVGAQIGMLMGLRRRPAKAQSADTGRHRRD